MPRDDDAVPIRREVLAARSERHVSAILLAPPLSLKRAAACAGCTLLVFGLFLVFAEYTSKVHVSGELEPTAGIIQVVAPQFSRIAGLHVRVGDSVKAGQVLAGLSSERVGSDDRITASLEARRTEREQLRELTVNSWPSVARHWSGSSARPRPISPPTAAPSPSRTTRSTVPTSI